ncbi:2-hydroxyacyl-CoA lyase [Arachis hypogaea]|nr:2-hydroxyacyl-CoA lyase [Arachis hypogaea]
MLLLFMGKMLLLTTMIHQPDPSVVVGDSSQNDEDAKNPLWYNAMILEALSALKDANGFDLNVIVNFIIELHVVAIIFNNRGVYGGDRRTLKEMNRPCKDDPTPTFFVPKAGYHALIEVFGGKGYLVGTSDELKSNLSRLENRPLSMLLLIPMLVQKVGGCNTRTGFQIICIILKLRFL